MFGNLSWKQYNPAITAERRDELLKGVANGYTKSFEQKMIRGFKEESIMTKIKIGFAPTRRSIFSAPDVIKYLGLTKTRLEELGVDFVDIDDINAEGFLYDEKDRLQIIEKFRREKIDGLFLPHTPRQSVRTLRDRKGFAQIPRSVHLHDELELE